MIDLIKKYIPRNILDFLYIHIDGYSKKSYSQEGEDMILDRIFKNKKAGFYVDIGAHHPYRFSNTCFFYKKGWTGLNVDAMPGSMGIFKKNRKRDINIEKAIGASKDKKNYYIFNEPALNTFDENLAKQRLLESKNYKIIQKIEFEQSTLEDLLRKYLPSNQKIDFLSIDVEGLDYEVLRSNNWEMYRPTIILIEALSNTLKSIIESEMHYFMEENGYTIYAKSFNTVFYKCND